MSVVVASHSTFSALKTEQQPKNTDFFLSFPGKAVVFYSLQLCNCYTKVSLSVAIQMLEIGVWKSRFTLSYGWIFFKKAKL